MTHSRTIEAPEIKNELALPFLSSGLIALLVLIALPLTQRITDIQVVDDPLNNIAPILKPPVVLESVIEPPKVEPQKIDKLKVEPKPLTIGMMENALSGVSLDGFGYGDVTIPYATTDLDGIIDIKDLTRAPSPVSQTQPVYPPSYKSSKIEGLVVLQFVVREDGSTSDLEVLKSSDRAFSEAAIRAVRRWTFIPGEKDGRIVKSRVQIQIPFNIK